MTIEDFDLLLVTLSSLYTFVVFPLVFWGFSKSSIKTWWRMAVRSSSLVYLSLKKKLSKIGRKTLRRRRKSARGLWSTFTSSHINGESVHQIQNGKKNSDTSLKNVLKSNKNGIPIEKAQIGATSNVDAPLFKVGWRGWSFEEVKYKSKKIK